MSTTLGVFTLVSCFFFTCFHSTPTYYGVHHDWDNDASECSDNTVAMNAGVTKFKDIATLAKVLSVPPLFLQDSSHSSGILVESGGIKISREAC